MNQPLTTPEAGYENLRRAIGELPQHRPAPATWAQLEARLATEATVQQLIPTLPEHTPDADLWQAIANRLEAPAAVAERPARRPSWQRWASGVAAAAVLALGWWQLAPAGLPGSRLNTADYVVYGEETIPEAALLAPLPALSLEELEQQGQEFIESQRLLQPALYESAACVQLRTRLHQLETEAATLEQQANATPEFRRRHTEQLNQKAAVTRELITLIIS